MQNIISVIAVLIAGAGLAFQAPTNAKLADISGSVIFGALVSFAVGTVALFLTWIAVGRSALPAFPEMPVWVWAGGLYGAVYVASMAYAAPRLGMASALALAIVGQFVAALVIDQNGYMGLDIQPLSALRIVGCLLIVAGAILARG